MIITRHNRGSNKALFIASVFGRVSTKKAKKYYIANFSNAILQ